MNRGNHLHAAALPRNPPHRHHLSSEVFFFLVSLAICVICFITAFHKQANSRQYSAGIVSEVFHFPESFVRDYERVERKLKVYIYPGGYFQSPTELTGMYGSEAYFFKNLKESRFLTTVPLKADLFFIPISWHQMRTQGTPYEKMISIVENYVESIISKYPYWNRTDGADHFFLICHDIGLEVADGVPIFSKNNSIRLVCPAIPYRDIPYKNIRLPPVNQPFSHPPPGNALPQVNRKWINPWAGIPNSEIGASLEHVESIISKYPYWNRTQGADHFFVICDEVGVEVADGVPFLKKNPIGPVCPAISYRDIALPPVNQPFSHPPPGNALPQFNRTSPGAGIPNSEIRASLEQQWKDDTELESELVWNDTAEGYLLLDDKIHRRKFCICLHGFPTNTSLIADSIRYECVPVIFSSYLNFPFNDVLDWHKFSIILAEKDVHLLRDTLKGIRGANFTRFQNNLLKVQKHFEWNSPPLRFDAFHMALFDLWQRHFYEPTSVLEIFPGKPDLVSAAIRMWIMAAFARLVLYLT